jgi:FtsH-binding integral membrane protein
MSQINSVSLTESQTDVQAFMSRVYLWMASALMVTAVVSAAVAANPRFQLQLIQSPLFLILLIGELGVVFVLSLLIKRLSAIAATMLFFAYAVLNGITLSIIFILYTDASITATFGVTAGTFALMSVIGYVTKIDLTRLGGFLLMGLIGIVLGSIVNLFLQNSAIYWIITYAGILIFVGLTAYDTQKLKRMAEGGLSGEVEHKASILGALTLYLDFINLFLMLLRVMGRRR